MLATKKTRRRARFESLTPPLLLLAVLAMATPSCGKQEAAPSESKPAAAKKPKEKKPAKDAAKDASPKKGAEGATWPNGAQLVVSISMQFETGGQPEGAESPFSASPLPKTAPDLPAASWFRYGANEGIPRMLDLWDKYGVKVTSHVVGEAALKYPELVKEIKERGHEIAAHGMTWAPQWNKSYAEELQFVKDGADALEKVTGVRPVGYNANWLRRSKNTLKVLQELGFSYHIDDVSRDEPFVTTVRGKPFAVIPYTLRNNDIVVIEGRHQGVDQFLIQLKREFDQLYAEGTKRRRMMSISLHDRIGGTPAMVRVVDQFLEHATKKAPRVVFMRKDEIAKLVLSDPKTPKDESEAAYNVQ